MALKLYGGFEALPVLRPGGRVRRVRKRGSSDLWFFELMWGFCEGQENLDVAFSFVFKIDFLLPIVGRLKFRKEKRW